MTAASVHDLNIIGHSVGLLARKARPLVLLSLATATVTGCSERPEPKVRTDQPQRATSTPTVDAAGRAPEPMDPAEVDRNNHAVGLMGKFEFDAARNVFVELAEAHPDRHDVRINAAIATLNRQQEGDEAKALELIEEVLRQAPGDLRAQYCAGLLKLYLQSPEEAIDHFKRVAEADPADAYAAYYVGQCLAQAQQYEQAAKWFGSAIALDPYLRSAYYAAAQALRGAEGREAEAAAMLEGFQKLQGNPRARLVEFKYTRMGPKGEALAVGDGARPAKPAPEGPMFADPSPLLQGAANLQWRTRRADRTASVTACDINMDGDIDVFIADCLDEGHVRNAVCLNDGSGQAFSLDLSHPLATVPDVNAALWGDWNNDGLTDVYLCCRGGNQLWKQQRAGDAPGPNGEPLESEPPREKAAWVDVTSSAGVAGEALDSVGGAIFDADHDGDLDIFVVNADGPNELFSNNRDGTFRPIAKESGIAGGRGSRQVMPVDLEGDRDLDLVVLNNQPPHEVWINDRLWTYHAGEAWRGLCQSDVARVLAHDADADGRTELLTASSGPRVRVDMWRPTPGGAWQPNVLIERHAVGSDAPDLMLADALGSGEPSMFVAGERACEVVNIERAQLMHTVNAAPDSVMRGWTLITMGSAGPAMVGVPEGGEPVIWRPGAGRHRYASVRFTGREISQGAASFRSNASGIGTHYAARIGSQWVAGSMLPSSTGAGQNLQPASIGLAGRDQVDFINIDWPDGVFQSEVALEGGKLHVIEETQRQLSSCPVIFAWNGTKHGFVTDCLGVGGIGYAVGRGEYAPSRPWENVLLPEGAIKPRRDRFEIKLSEPMEEACYLDAVRLTAYDLPPGWRMTIDDRMSIMGPEPTGAPLFHQTDITPSFAVNDRGEDVTDAVIRADLVAAPVSGLDERFIGRLTREHTLALRFDGLPEAGLGTGSRILTLIIDGWVEYPYSQTMFAAWQADAAYQAPTLEVRGDDGRWRVLLEQFGYPAGMPRQMSVPVPIDQLPSGTCELRLRTNQEIYYDRIALAWTEPNQQAKRHELKMTSADLRQSGFPLRTTGPQRQPAYDYDRRAPLWDCRHQRGMHTALGPVQDLVRAVDDAVAIFGPGEEVHMGFDAGLEPLAPGWSRRFVLELNGWCKDMDLFTKDGQTIEPLPMRQPETGDAPGRDALHQRWNTRLMGH